MCIISRLLYNRWRLQSWRVFWLVWMEWLMPELSEYPGRRGTESSPGNPPPLTVWKIICSDLQCQKIPKITRKSVIDKSQKCLWLIKELFFFGIYCKPFCYSNVLKCRNVLWLIVEKGGFVMAVRDNSQKRQKLSQKVSTNSVVYHNIHTTLWISMTVIIRTDSPKLN